MLKWFLCKHYAPLEAETHFFLPSCEFVTTAKLRDAQNRDETRENKKKSGHAVSIYAINKCMHSYNMTDFRFCTMKKGRRMATMRNCHKYDVFILFYSFRFFLNFVLFLSSLLGCAPIRVSELLPSIKNNKCRVYHSIESMERIEITSHYAWQ